MAGGFRGGLDRWKHMGAPIHPDAIDTLLRREITRARSGDETTLTMDGTAITTGTLLDLTSLTAMTTGVGLRVFSDSPVLGDACLIDAQHEVTSASLSAFTQSGIRIRTTRTNTATSGTVADNYDSLKINRSSTQNGAGGTFTAAGSVLRLTNAATETAGTMTDSVNLIEMTQQAASTGHGVTIDFNATSGTGSPINIDQDGNDAGTINAIVIDTDNAGAGNQTALRVVMVDEAKSVFAEFANDTSNWTSASAPQTNAPDGWIKIRVNGTDQFIPWYNA